MNRPSKIIFALFLSFVFESAYADNFPSSMLPIKPALRPEGIQQIGDTCHAAAFLTALEHHFQRIDKPVKLSLFYLVYSLRSIIEKSTNNEAVPYNAEYYDADSLPFLEKHGSVIPHYMHPEEHRMTSAFFSSPKRGARYFLAPKLANVPEEYNVGWPTLRSHILVHDLNGSPMFLSQNRNPIEVLKETVVSNKPAILAFTGYAIQGLFENTSYNKANLLERKVLNSAEENNPRREIPKNILDKFFQDTSAMTAFTPGAHSFALVGYDDSLYQDYGYKTKGGFILKGTWDDSSHEYTSIPYQIILDLVDLNARRAMDFIKCGEIGPAMFVLKLQFLELPNGFDDDVFKLYNQYKDEERFQIVYFPYLYSLFGARKEITAFNDFVSDDFDLDKLSSEKEQNFRKLMVSFFSPWNANYLVNVAVLSGVARMDSFIRSEAISFPYKEDPESSIHPQEYYMELFKEARGNISFLQEKPEDVSFWYGFFNMADLVIRYIDSVNAADAMKDEI